MLQSVIRGRSTEEQAERLAAFFQTMKEDDIVRHGDLAKLIEEDYPSDRYRSVLAAGRKRFYRLSGGVVMRSISGVGYQKATGSDQLQLGVGKLRAGVRQIQRATTVCADIDDKRLDDTGRQKRDHVVGRTKYLAELAKAERKALEVSVGKVESLPSMRVAVNE